MEVRIARIFKILYSVDNHPRANDSLLITLLKSMEVTQLENVVRGQQDLARCDTYDPNPSKEVS